MDPLTHAVVGLSLAVLMGEPASITNPAVLGCVAGAMIPDGDIVLQLKGDYAYLKNHRGASHSIPVLFVYAAALGGLLSLIFGFALFTKILLFSLLGCLSHIVLDITNSYGAQIFWPIYKKKVTLDLLLIYDPMLIFMALAIILPALNKHVPSAYAIGAFMVYLSCRLLMKKHVKMKIVKNLGQDFDIKYLRVLPSMIGLIKWHFIVKGNGKKIIGEVNLLPRKFNIIKTMEDIDHRLSEMVLQTPIARFFKEFTPIFHIACEKHEQGYTFKFIDLRYFLAKDFLHHATAVINHDLEVVASLFHPYTKSKKVQV